MAMTIVSTTKKGKGEQRVYTHFSKETDCEMKFGVFMPPAALGETAVQCPVLYFLSDWTHTHKNFIANANMQKWAEKHGIIVVNPDTSPRNLDLCGQDTTWYVGYGAGFYVDATEEPWCRHYRMYSYVMKELIELTINSLPINPTKKCISGFGMGGHGALICALKNPTVFRSVSVFAPVANVMKHPWGKYALLAYLGSDEKTWEQWDATHLAANYVGPKMEILLDQGGDDPLLHKQHLLPGNLFKAAEGNARLKITYKERGGYDHGFSFVATFMPEHFSHHAKFLKRKK